MLDALGVRTFDTTEMYKALQNEEWLAGQTPEWFIELYCFLYDLDFCKMRGEQARVELLW